ncbi:MAG: glycoside hydrolase family 127 protein [Siphonobacter sp.]
MRKLGLCLLLGLTIHASGQSYVPERHNSYVKVQPIVPVKAYSFPLGSVQLRESPFRQAEQADLKYLESLNADRLLSEFRSHAGLKPKAEKYGGWESSGLAGHTLGHYLSACAMHYAVSKDPAYLKRVNYIVSELKECQVNRKTGYIGAIPKEDSVFAEVAKGNIRSRGFDLNGAWSPWYTVHKVMAGLLDAYLYCHNQEALKLCQGMADWTGSILKNLTDEQNQKMLLCEYGGMNEMLVNLYSFTKQKQYLDLSYQFHDRRILDSLANHRDILPGKHSNTQIPKLIGTIRRYELTGNHSDRESATFFWNTVVKHHSYAPGGNSNYEYLSSPDSLSEKLTENTMETCNTYNMLKLTRHLFALQPQASYMDYYERALYNHILASQNHTTGMMCYFVPLRMGVRKDFSSPEHDFTCCVGSGMENHVKYSESIYFQGQDGSLYVNLFIPSNLNWTEKKLQLELQTRLPADSTVSLRFSPQKALPLTLRIRKPAWVRATQLLLNGKPLADVTIEDSYWVIRRVWQPNDELSLSLSASFYAVSMPDNAGRQAFFYGPVLLAGNLGKDEPDPSQGLPVLVQDRPDPNTWISGDVSALKFQTATSRGTLTLQPFYSLQDDYYSVYWDVFSRDGWQKEQQRYEEKQRLSRQLDQHTSDMLRPGEMQPERDHDFTGENLETGEAHTRKYRVANKGGSLRFIMKTHDSQPNTLLITYWGMDNRGRQFEIFVDDQKLTKEDLNKYKESRFYDISYPIPTDWTKGKSRVTIRFQALPNQQAGPFYGARMIHD